MPHISQGAYFSKDQVRFYILYRVRNNNDLISSVLQFSKHNNIKFRLLNEKETFKICVQKCNAKETIMNNNKAPSVFQYCKCYNRLMCNLLPSARPVFCSLSAICKFNVFSVLTKYLCPVVIGFMAGGVTGK